MTVHDTCIAKMEFALLVNSNPLLLHLSASCLLVDRQKLIYAVTRQSVFLGKHVLWEQQSMDAKSARLSETRNAVWHVLFHALSNCMIQYALHHNCVSTALLYLCFVIWSLIILPFPKDSSGKNHCLSLAANCLQHVRFSGLGVIVCKSRVAHRAHITHNMPCATLYEGTARLLSLTELKSHLFNFILLTEQLTYEGGVGGRKPLVASFKNVVM